MLISEQVDLCEIVPCTLLLLMVAILLIIMLIFNVMMMMMTMMVIADIYISISMGTFEHRKYKSRSENGNK